MTLPKNKETEKVWIIFNLEGNKIGILREDMAEDAADAVLSWADENLNAELMNREDAP